MRPVRRLQRNLLFSCGLFFFTPVVFGNDLSGYVGIEGRYFIEDPQHEGKAEHNGSMTLNSDYYRDFDSGNQRFAFTLYGRADSEDNERTHMDLREFYWWKNFDSFELYIGLRKVFWGVTESVHLVDVINQTDTLENVDGEDKLGQPTIEFATVQDWGTLSAFVMPYFREREFVGERSRLRPNVKILDDPVYQASNEEQHVDFALRWSHYLGIWDYGLSYFSGTGRDPIFEFVGLDGGVANVRPVYRQIEQAGVDVQATIEAWLLKLEAVSIYEKEWGRNSAAALGLEYTFFTVGGTNADLGVVAEYQFDDRVGPREKTSQNDVVLGVRWAFNDLDGSELLALISQDLDYSNQFLSIEMSRRLNDKWKLEAEARVFSNIEEESPEFDFRADDYVQLELRRYF